MTATRDLRDQLKALDVGLDEVAGDLAGLGLLDPPREPRPRELDDALRVAELELEVARQSLAALAATLRLVRDRHLARQLERAAGADGALQLCLTGTPTPGWITVGFPPADVGINLRWGLPFADGAAAYVYFALALEHLCYRTEALRALEDVRRVLRPGGVLRLVVPDMEAYFRAYVAGDAAFFDAHRDFWDWAVHAKSPIDLTLMMAGAGQGRGPGDFFGHKMGYDFETLRRLLADAGFASIERSGYQRSRHPALRVDDRSHDASYGDGAGSFNLFVEAVTPPSG